MLAQNIYCELILPSQSTKDHTEILKWSFIRDKKHLFDMLSLKLFSSAPQV